MATHIHIHKTRDAEGEARRLNGRTRDAAPRYTVEIDLRAEARAGRGGYTVVDNAKQMKVVGRFNTESDAAARARVMNGGRGTKDAAPRFKRGDDIARYLPSGKWFDSRAKRGTIYNGGDIEKAIIVGGGPHKGEMSIDLDIYYTKEAQKERGLEAKTGAWIYESDLR